MTGSFVLAFQIFAGALCVAALILFALRMPRRAGAATVRAKRSGMKSGVRKGVVTR